MNQNQHELKNKLVVVAGGAGAKREIAICAKVRFAVSMLISFSMSSNLSVRVRLGAAVDTQSIGLSRRQTSEKASRKAYSNEDS